MNKTSKERNPHTQREEMYVKKGQKCTKKRIKQGENLQA
jgi:hypothetical protein